MMDHQDDASKDNDRNNDDSNDPNTRRIQHSFLNKLTQAKSTAAKINATIDHDAKHNKNELTALLPGYTAPLRLETPIHSLTTLSVTQLRKEASTREKNRYRSQISLKNSVQPTSSLSLTKKIKTPSSLANPHNIFQTTTTSFTSSLRNKPTKQNDTTAGSKWFHMTPTPLTPTLQSDLALIKQRTYLNPKKFYKSSDVTHKIVQSGTVIEGSNEYNRRLTKKERKRNFTEEVMGDVEVMGYAKRKFGESQMEKERRRGGKKLKRVGGGKKRR